MAARSIRSVSGRRGSCRRKSKRNVPLCDIAGRYIGRVG